MREILFRGKTEQFGNWIEGSLIVGRDLESGQLEYLIAPLSAYYTEVKKVIPETIVQYTGLTDKNGTKIFEGDIVKDEYGCVGVVEFGEGTFDSGVYRYYGWHTKDKDGTVDHNELYIYDEDNFFKIIGNIYNNPEVLGGE